MAHQFGYRFFGKKYIYNDVALGRYGIKSIKLLDYLDNKDDRIKLLIKQREDWHSNFIDTSNKLHLNEAKLKSKEDVAKHLQSMNDDLIRENRILRDLVRSLKP